VKLLLLGADGQVGQALRPLLAGLGSLRACGRAEADLEEPAAIAALIAREAPDVIVNAAAYTAVDAAEDDRDRAYRVNAEAVGAIGEAARKRGALSVHYSTDFVFDGAGHGAYAETDTARPLGVYGASKLAGDEALAASGADHLILRVSWNYSAVGRNFPLTILRLAATRDGIDVVADEYGAATAASLIAEATCTALRQTLADRGKTGLYHLSAAGSASRHELARFIVAEAAAQGAVLALKPENIRPVRAAAYGLKARRPSNSRLDTGKFSRAFGVELPPWQAGVRQLITTLIGEGRL